MKYLKILILLVIICILIVISDIILSETRGYGFDLFKTVSRTRMLPPSYFSQFEMGGVRDYFRNYTNQIPDDRLTPESNLPLAEEVAQNVLELELSESQPYKEHEIWILVSKKRKIRYLYKQMSIIPSHPSKIDHEIIMCSFYEWEGPKGTYNSYKNYPEWVLDYLGGEQWASFVNNWAVYFSKEIFPPIPGALIISEKSGLHDVTIYYPEEILPALKAIYPNLQIPQERIVNTKKN